MDIFKKEYGLIYDGEMKEGLTGKHTEDKNPANGKTLAMVAAATYEDVDMAVASAVGAFKSWKLTSRSERALLLNKIAEAIEQEKEHLALVESMDTGKCLDEARMQMDICAAHYRYFAGAIIAHEDSYVQHDNGSFSLISREPLGTVAMILPWNAPSMLLAWKAAPALAAGNCAVVKPASNAPLPVLEMALLFQKILPPGVLNVVTGSGSVAGDYLLKHKDINKISFTGSTEVGCLIGEKAGRDITHCTLELGGKSANIVFADAPIEKAIEFAQIAILASSGQVCVAGSRLFLQEEIYDSFLEKLKAKFEAVTVGDPLKPGVQMGPVIDEAQMNKILSYVDIGVKEGARLVCGGKRLTGGEFDSGFYVAPTIFADADNNSRIAQEEIFGPVLTVLKFKTEEEVIKMANDSDYGLGAGVWTRDMNRAIRISRALEAGTVWVNDYLNSIQGGPFGGYKKSGIGREVHKVALEYYSQIKNICINPLP